SGWSLNILKPTKRLNRPSLYGGMMMRGAPWRHLAIVALAAAGLMIGCSDDSDDGDSGGGASGEEYYQGSLSMALGAEGNEADCAQCHSNDGTQDGWPGYTFQNIAFRSAFKGGDAPDLLSGANACVTGWMGGTALTETDEAWIALKGYLESISDSSVTDPNGLAPEVLADEAAYEAAYAGGDATAGEAAYTKACASCHDAALTVGTVASFPKATLAAFSIGRIAQKVRTSGPPPSGMSDAADTTPGPMPFFEPADLSTTDLQNIIAFIKSGS
ncbi:MAG: cytochrome c, partial [Myxococcota bacterium]